MYTAVCLDPSGRFTSPLPPSAGPSRRHSGPKPRFQPQNHEAQPPSRPRPSKTSHPKGVSPEGHFETHLGNLRSGFDVLGPSPRVVCLSPRVAGLPPRVARLSPRVVCWNIWGICGGASMFRVWASGMWVYLPGLRAYLPGLRVYLPGLCVGGANAMYEAGRYKRWRVVPATMPSPKTTEPSPET